jgi:hypothetical protein
VIAGDHEAARLREAADALFGGRLGSPDEIASVPGRNEKAWTTPAGIQISHGAAIASSRPSMRLIPVFGLYGEVAEATIPDFVHAERIGSSASLYGWRQATVAVDADLPAVQRRARPDPLGMDEVGNRRLGSGAPAPPRPSGRAVMKTASARGIPVFGLYGEVAEPPPCVTTSACDRRPWRWTPISQPYSDALDPIRSAWTGSSTPSRSGRAPTASSCRSPTTSWRR